MLSQTKRKSISVLSDDSDVDEDGNSNPYMKGAVATTVLSSASSPSSASSSSKKLIWVCSFAITKFRPCVGYAFMDKTKAYLSFSDYSDGQCRRILQSRPEYHRICCDFLVAAGVFVVEAITLGLQLCNSKVPSTSFWYIFALYAFIDKTKAYLSFIRRQRRCRRRLQSRPGYDRCFCACVAVPVVFTIIGVFVFVDEEETAVINVIVEEETAKTDVDDEEGARQTEKGKTCSAAFFNELISPKDFREVEDSMGLTPLELSWHRRDGHLDSR